MCFELKLHRNRLKKIFRIMVDITIAVVFSSCANWVVQRFYDPIRLGFLSSIGLFVDISRQEIVFLIILVFGATAFTIKKWSRRLYGLMEISFGAYGGGVCLLVLLQKCQGKCVHQAVFLPDHFEFMTKSPTGFSQYVAFASAIYIIVRGIENLVSET